MIKEAKALIFLWNGSESELLQGQDQTLRALHRGAKLALVTTATRSAVMAFLEQAGVQPMRFNTIFTRKEVGVDIAAGQLMVTKAVETFQGPSSYLSRNQLAVIGNTPEHMQEATLARIGFIAVASGAQRDQLLQAGAAPEQIIPNLEALPNFLRIFPGSAAY